MKTNEIRKSFLEYFEKKGHTIVPSSSLVPQNDPTLLFTNAGMVQFKDVFLGKEKSSYKRAASSQKCVRAGGKHNDLENVGYTARHHTFFEMLGNFSFGDYFKKEAILFAWEFVTKELKLPVDKLYVSVFEKDDEAEEIWQKEIGLQKSRIFRMGEKDNFWAMGETGPCGPCSEIFIDRGEKYGCGKKDCTVGCDCDRFMEFWNLVFMQYNRDEAGTLTPLPKPSVDTGAGLERLASILQDVPTNYDTDLFLEIISKTAGLLGKKYLSNNSEESVALRVIADHSRAATFLVADGVIPSNEGRGYVLRRIIRRAIRYGKKIGFEKPFLHKVCNFVIQEMKADYPYLLNQKDFIEKCVLAEEEQFFRTLSTGLNLLESEIKRTGRGGVLPGEVAFKLYDTFGFPLDLTKLICREQSVSVDEKTFENFMIEQRERSRKHWKGSGEEAIDQEYQKTSESLRAQNKIPIFVGYDDLKTESVCTAIISQKDGLVEAVFEKTPFYGESGGQVGDRGKVFSLEGNFEGQVVDVQKPVQNLPVIKIKVLRGEIYVGKKYLQEVDEKRRSFIKKNHTATHLLQWALRKTLGPHVKQAGSLVDQDFFRFDFSHFQQLSENELKEVESLVNEKIWAGEKVKVEEMTKEEAEKRGAIAFFGEKYGNRVRVVTIGDFSSELCGGTHVSNTSEINLFKIASEASIASGVRRITAHVSKAAYEYSQEKEEESKLVRLKLKAANKLEIEQKLEKMFETEKSLRKEIEKHESKNLSQELNDLEKTARKLGDSSDLLITSLCLYDPSGVKKLRDAADRIRQKISNSVVVLGMQSASEKKAFLLIAVGKETSKKYDANKILQKLSPYIEGRGGGKPDLAQAGGTCPEGVQKALDCAQETIEKI